MLRLTVYNFRKKKIVMNSFFDAQFNYCPLTWMLHSRKKKIKHLHERCLRLIYSDKESSYENLLEKSRPNFITPQAQCLSWNRKYFISWT